jgi:F-type H+-transporting ATPase subunit b
MRVRPAVVFQILVLGVFALQARAAGSPFRFNGYPMAVARASSAITLAFFTPQEGEGDSGKGSEGTFYEWFNFALLVGGLVYLLRKPVSGYFSTRSANLRKSLEEGRKALKESGQRLQLIEQKLAHLNEEIAVLKGEAAKEMDAEAERMRRQTLLEVEKILGLARTEIEAATRSAKLELKAFAATQATEIARQMVRARLNAENQSKLVQRFFEGLNGKG